MWVLLFAAVIASGPTTVDNNIVLDATEKHIVRVQYHDDEAVAMSGDAAGGWRLYAGAAIDAQRIDLTMRNVKGAVRFRADWSRIRSVLDRVEQQRVVQPR